MTENSELDQLDDDPDHMDENDVEQLLPEKVKSKPAKSAKAKATKAGTQPKAKLTPEQMEERIAALEAENSRLSRRAQSAPAELPENPDDEVTVNIPLTSTGYPISIQGKKYFGKMPVKRRILDTILSMLGNHAQIQSELTQKRGTQVRMGQLAAEDTVSRIKQRSLGRHIIDGAA